VNPSRASLSTRFPSFLPDCAELVTERIGADLVKGVFICGSVAAGEETFVSEVEPPILLSDVDLVAVPLSLATLKEWYPRRFELGAACEGLVPGLQFSGRVDVGLLLPGDLAKLPARPGVYDMRSAGRVLGGDPRLLDLIPAYERSAIAAREGVILVENRIASFLGSYPPECALTRTGIYEFLYQVARVYTDIAVAALCVAGRYEPGYVRRRVLLKEAAEGAGERAVASLVSAEIRSKVDRWTSFKLEPSMGALGVAPEPHILRRVWIDAGKDLLWFWRQALSYLRDPAADLLHPLAVEALVGKGRGSGGWADHARGWRAFLSRYPAMKRCMLAGSLGARLFTSAPLDLVREHAVRLLHQRLAFGGERRVAGGVLGFPHGGGAWAEAAWELSSTWKEIVFGRKDPGR
jgi:hypothetical protein